MKSSVAALTKIMGLFLLLASCGAASTLRSHVFHELMDFRNQRANQASGKEPPMAPQWWSEDYGMPERRQPVHNKVEP
ncbi:hypothetical protein ACJRO7_005191 [Eucalyptus globulus]|uniref:Uncharacterized protein n=1 Tax=Eucalyptus globulus TaxID=34317 RepID=A0ABD3IYW7_EUCGL